MVKSGVVSWKEHVDNLILYSGVLKGARKYISEKVVILMYHRVPGESSGGACFDCKTFENQISYLNKYNKIVSLDRIVKCLKDQDPFPENSVVITFDDGYIDNYLYAYPVLKKYNVPATIFLSTDFIDNKQLLTVDKMEYVITKSKKNYLEIDFSNYDSCMCADLLRIRLGDERLSTVNSIMKIVQGLSNPDKAKLIDELAVQLCVKVPDIVNEERYTPLLWDQIREMSGNKITFGGHTCQHSALITLDYDEKYSELAVSKKIIEERLNKNIDCFAYPYGYFDDEVKDILKSVGFKGAVSTVLGINDSHADCFELKRYNAAYSLTRFARITSGFNFIKNELFSSTLKR